MRQLGPAVRPIAGASGGPDSNRRKNYRSVVPIEATRRIAPQAASIIKLAAFIRVIRFIRG